MLWKGHMPRMDRAVSGCRGSRGQSAGRKGAAHSRVKLAVVGGLRLSQLSALSLLETSSSELETDEPTSTSSNFLLSPEPENASIGFKWFAWGANHDGPEAAHHQLARSIKILPKGEEESALLSRDTPAKSVNTSL